MPLLTPGSLSENRFRPRRLRFLFDDLLVLFGGEKVGFFGGAELDDPAFPVGVVVDLLRRILQRRVDLDDLAAYRRVKGGDGLDALDGAEGVAGPDGDPHIGQLHEDHVAQFLLGMVRDAYGHGTVLRADPLVALRVLKVVRYAQGSPLSSLAFIER